MVISTTKETKVHSVFYAFFKSRQRVKPADGLMKTPERGNMSTPAAPASGLRSLFRRGSSSSRQLSFSNLDESPAQSTTTLPPQSASRHQSNSEPDSSQEAMRKLQVELERLKQLNSKLEQENVRIRGELEKAANVPSSTEPSNNANNSVPQDTGDLVEAQMRLVDLQVQVSDAKNEIFRLGAELIQARSREQELEQYVAAIVSQQQQQSQTSTIGKVRSPIPPCVPLPGTKASIEWLHSIRTGNYEDYWQKPEATQQTITQGLPLPPTISSTSVDNSRSGKPRSDIPPAPPLPPGMVPTTGKQLETSVFSASQVQGRRGSAPGLLETVPHMKKKESAFASAIGLSKPELKPLFWTAFDQNKVQGTIFENLSQKPVMKPEVMQQNLKALTSRFAKRATKSLASEAKGNGNTSATQQAPRITIMDSKRKQQIGIGLSGSFRNVKISEIRKAINNLDTSILTIERVKQLLEMIPTPEEIKNIEDLRSGGLLDAAFFAGISKEESFFNDMAFIPRLKVRLQCICVEYQFHVTSEQAKEDLQIFLNAIKVIKESTKWKEFLAICLETGNFMNEGNNGLGGAWGFSVKEGLKKFSEMKSCENNSKFSLMHWIAEVADTHKPELFDLIQEFAPVDSASVKSLEEMKNEINSIRRQVDLVKGEVDKCKIDSSEGSSSFLKRMVPFLEAATGEVQKMQEKLEIIDKEAHILVTMHGENPQTTTCQMLFESILNGILSFCKCRDEIISQRLAEEKASRPKLENFVNPGSVRKQQSLRDMGDAGKMELEAAMAKRRKPQ